MSKVLCEYMGLKCNNDNNFRKAICKEEDIYWVFFNKFSLFGYLKKIRVSYTIK